MEQDTTIVRRPAERIPFGAELDIPSLSRQTCDAVTCEKPSSPQLVGASVVFCEAFDSQNGIHRGGATAGSDGDDRCRLQLQRVVRLEAPDGAPQGCAIKTRCVRKQTWESDCALCGRVWCGVVLSLTHMSKRTHRACGGPNDQKIAAVEQSCEVVDEK
eukprot:813718-Prorocentrum_minimum.AAC.1